MVRQLDGTLVRKTGRLVKYKPPKTFDNHYRQALFAAYKSNRQVYQAFGHAVQLAKRAGTEIDFEECNIFIPRDIDPEWRAPVREVYPWARGKAKKR